VKISKVVRGSETLDMTSEGFGEMFEGDSADTCLSPPNKFQTFALLDEVIHYISAIIFESIQQDDVIATT
jgi:hypothetical protein